MHRTVFFSRCANILAAVRRTRTQTGVLGLHHHHPLSSKVDTKLNFSLSHRTHTIHRWSGADDKPAQDAKSATCGVPPGKRVGDLHRSVDNKSTIRRYIYQLLVSRFKRNRISPFQNESPHQRGTRSSYLYRASSKKRNGTPPPG